MCSRDVSGGSCAPCAGGREGRAACAVGTVMCCVLLVMYAGGRGRELSLLAVIRCVLLCILEAVEGGLCLLEVLEASEAMRCVLLCMPEVPEVMRCVILCMLEAGLCFAGGVGGAGSDALCATLYAGGAGGGGALALFAGGVGGTGSDAPCATRYVGGCVG